MKSKVGHTWLSEPESDLICNWTRIQRSKIEIKLINCVSSHWNCEMYNLYYEPTEKKTRKFCNYSNFWLFLELNFI